MANEFKVKKGLIVAGASGGTVVDVQGSQGQLFSVTDDLSGSIFAVSDISGVPILDVNSNGTIQFSDLSAGTLVTDANGNISVSSGGGAGGPYLPLSAGSSYPLTGDLYQTMGAIGVAQTDQDYIAKIYELNSDGFMSLYTGQPTPLERIRISSYGDSFFVPANNGNVGIGTTSPGEKLSVYDSSMSTGYVASFGNTSNLELLIGTTTGAYLNIQGSNISSGASYNISLQNDGGNVGIGVTDPEKKLEVKSDTTYDGIMIDVLSAPEITFRDRGNSDTKIGTGRHQLDGFHIDTYSGNAFFIKGSNRYVGIGTTSPSSLLHLESESSPALQIKDTTNNVTFKAYAQNSNTHLANSSNHDLFIDTNNISRIAVKANGNVGIGTTSPSAKLQVAGTTTYNSDSAQALRVCDAADVSKGIHIGFDTTLDAGIIQAADFGVSYRNLLLNPNANNVGIGTTSPGKKLHVDSGSTSDIARFENDNGFFTLGQTSNQTSLDLAASNAYRIRQGSTVPFYIKSDGNVGIGTTSPAVKLQVYGSAMPATGDPASVEDLLTLYRGGSQTVWSGGASLALGRYSTGGSSAPRSRLDFKLKDAAGSNTALPETTVMTMQSNGNVGIGTTSPTADLHIQGSSATDLPILRVGGFGNSGSKLELAENVTSGNMDYGYSFFNDGNSSNTLIIKAHNNNTTGITAMTIDRGNALTTFGPVPVVGTRTAGDNTTRAASTAFVTSAVAGVPIGDYLPLSAGSNYPLTDTLYIKPSGSPTNTMLISARANNTYGNIQFTNAAETANWTELRSTSTQFTINNVNVGIGTTSPTYKLHVDDNNAYGGILIEGDNAPGLSIRDNSGTSLSKIYVQSTSSSQGNLRISSDDNNTATTPTIEFLIGNSHKMRILDNGNVGIGTTSPSTRLEVSSSGANGILISKDPNSTSNSGRLFFETDTVSEGFSFLNSNGLMTIRSQAQAGATSGNVRVAIDSSGNVGIGTTSPEVALHIDSTDLGQTENDTTTQAIFSTRNSNASKLYIQDYRTADGNSWTSSGKRIQEKIDSTWMGYMQFNGDSNNGGISFGTGNNTTQGNVGERMRITSVGNVGIGTTSPVAKLDVRGNAAFIGGNEITTNLYVHATNTAGSPARTACIDMQGYEGRAIGTFFKDVSYSSGVVQEWFAGINYAGDFAKYSIGFDATDGTPTPEYLADAKFTVTNLGNVGIGTYDPNSRLEVVGDGGTVLDIQGSQGQLFSVTDDLSGDIFSVADISGVPIMNVNSNGTSYFDGNVGIGTTSPSAKLEVDGQIVINSTALDGQDAFSIYNNTNELLNVQNSSTGDEASLFLSANNVRKIKLDTDGSSYFNGGNVGIGTTSPSSKLHVIGGSGDDIIARFKTTGTGTNDYSEIHILNNNDDKLVLGSIGSNFASSTWAGMRYVYATAGDLGLKATASDGNVRIYAGSAGNERMRINSDGNVGIGTTSPGSKLSVVSPLGGIGADFQINGGSGFGTKNVRIEIPGYGEGLQFTSFQSSTVDDIAIAFYQDANKRGSIVINATSTSYNTTSDYRLKENKEIISDAIERVKALKPVKFNWISEPSQPKMDGFYAHELAEVVPEAVTGEKDALDHENNPDYQSIDQSKIVPLLSAALQQAINKIELLEQRIQLIENK